jgi:uncharacterized protein YqfB (UPF0267 family)
MLNKKLDELREKLAAQERMRLREKKKKCDHAIVIN